MNTAILLRSLGTMVLLLGVAMGICVGLAFIVPSDASHSSELELKGWSISLSITFALGMILYFCGVFRGRKLVGRPVMRRREAMGLVGLGWVTCSIVASLPYLFCSPYVPVDSAIFEGVSGLTTTGATIFTHLETLPKTILLWRSVTQWVGGMGILAMFVVVLSGMTASSKTLIGAESSLSSSDIASLRQTMRKLWVLYFSFTIVCGLGLWGFGLSPFQAVNHSLTAVSTGGFGTENASIGSDSFGIGSKIWIIVFMVLGGISFPFYLSLGKRKWSDIRERFEEVWWFLGIIISVCTMLLIQHAIGDFDKDSIDIIFNVVSIVTSTGYVSSDYEQWSRLGVGTLLLLMMVGGCSGSTSGGLKVSRIILWIRFMRANLQRTFRPQAVTQIKLNGKVVPDKFQEQLFLVISLFGFFAITGTLIFQLLEPNHSLLGSMSSVISCLGNIGPALAEMGPTESFAETRPLSKLLFALMMILGRLEYIALLVLFSRQLWKKY